MEQYDAIERNDACQRGDNNAIFPQKRKKGKGRTVPIARHTNCTHCERRPTTEWNCLTHQELRLLDGTKIDHELDAGENVYVQGDECNGIYCLRSGLVGLRRVANQQVLNGGAGDETELGGHHHLGGQGMAGLGKQCPVAHGLAGIDQPHEHRMAHRIHLSQPHQPRAQAIYTIAGIALHIDIFPRLQLVIDLGPIQQAQFLMGQAIPLSGGAAFAMGAIGVSDDWHRFLPFPFLRFWGNITLLSPL